MDDLLISLLKTHGALPVLLVWLATLAITALIGAGIGIWRDRHRQRHQFADERRLHDELARYSELWAALSAVDGRLANISSDLLLEERPLPAVAFWPLLDAYEDTLKRHEAFMARSVNSPAQEATVRYSECLQSLDALRDTLGTAPYADELLHSPRHKGLGGAIIAFANAYTKARAARSHLEDAIRSRMSA